MQRPPRVAVCLCVVLEAVAALQIILWSLCATQICVILAASRVASGRLNSIDNPRRFLCGLVVQHDELLIEFNRLVVALARSQDHRETSGVFAFVKLISDGAFVVCGFGCCFGGMKNLYAGMRRLMRGTNMRWKFGSWRAEPCSLDVRKESKSSRRSAPATITNQFRIWCCIECRPKFAAHKWDSEPS